MNQVKEQKLRAIIFDFGGVLIDWNPRYLFRKLFDDENAIEQFLIESEFADWNLEQDKGRTFDEGVAEHSKKFPQHAAMLRAYNERYLETIGGEISGTVEILYALKGAGYPLYGLSNWALEKFLPVRARYAFFDVFDAFVISSEVKVAKPDPRIFTLLLERIGLRAEECLFIDDAEKNIVVARELNFQTIHFQSPEQLARELRQLSILD